MNKKNEEDVIDLASLFRYLLDHAFLIITIAIICGIFGFSYSKFLVEPQYQATSGIYIVSKNSVIDYSSLMLSTNLTNDYSEIAQSRNVAETVVEKSGVDLSWEEVRSLLTLNNPSDTRILYFTITYTDPAIACKLANTYSDVLRDKITEIMNVDKPTLFQEAVINPNKVSPSNTKYAIIGILLGGVLMCGIFAFKYITDDTVSTSEDIENYFGLKTLAPIPADAEELKARKKRMRAAKRGGKKK